MEYHSGGSLPLLGRPRYCPGATADGGYLCETGHCCGETGCCTYYYELWWFWMLWTVLIVFSCCCAYRHRRAKQRVQQQQRQREISLLAYHGASSYPSSMLDLSFLASLKLPSYEEVAAQPSTPPPPYSSVFTTPRYPQPPRAADPHLLTQHGPLLHHPLSDGPSSLSSDNSSSCSCDSCCPSSPCSSSLSAPITYETDTSHASTPSDAAPLALDVTLETIAAVSIDMSGADGAGSQEPDATDPSVPDQTVTVAIVTGAASPPGPEPILPTAQQLEPEPHLPTVSACSSSSPPGPRVDPQSVPAPKSTSALGCPPPADSASNSPMVPTALEDLASARTLDSAVVPCSPTSEPSSHTVRTLVLDPDPGSGSVPAASGLIPAPVGLRNLELCLLSVPADPVDSDVAPSQQPATPRVSDSDVDLSVTPVATRVSDSVVDPSVTPGTDPPSPTSAQCVDPAVSPEPGVVQGPSSPGSLSGVLFCPDSAAAPDYPGAAQSDPTPSLVPDFQAGSGSDPLPYPCPVLAVPSPASPPSSCPVITVDSESALSPHAAPGVLTPPSPPSPAPLPTPALLLDPLTALGQPDKGGCSSGHASSLSPSPRATQSPPKQTVFSPCVDVFEPGPAPWGGGEEEQEEEDDEDDVGADESQYRHRRLTGDSGIEVCRCRVKEEEEEEEEEEVKEEGKAELEGGGRGVEEEKAGVHPDLHDSMDCPARGQRTTAGAALTLCTAAATPPCPDGGKAAIAMETV
ncbi:vegetative cell wall protein gp1-like [Salarias fasciatus]|uniref:Vegetative cell wall protein gp1-like n=1 Tax=Salarias fasciatus TaxID=181472 RepID=A0A672FPI6_SALFA|nr:vegetative cell wall protein gp1-like [Salarias fasciatus]XP_029975682.1 vegetative cell wall protein gp1-like [Salarias fasciatus]